MRLVATLLLTSCLIILLTELFELFECVLLWMLQIVSMDWVAHLAELLRGML